MIFGEAFPDENPLGDAESGVVEETPLPLDSSIERRNGCRADWREDSMPSIQIEVI
jgi:hypothetical protein